MNENNALFRSIKLLRIILASCLFMSFSFTLLLAQEISVSGTVSNSEDGSSLPGVNVHILGTATGSITSIDCQYTLTVPGAGIECSKLTAGQGGRYGYDTIQFRSWIRHQGGATGKQVYCRKQPALVYCGRRTHP